jgi:ribose transport system permease protein
VETGERETRADWRGKMLDRAPFLVACLMLTVIVAIYGSYQTGVFTLDELNLDTSASMTLMLAATGQTIVLLRGGIDLSIGGMISLGTVIAATQFGETPGSVAVWSLAILAIGLGVGALNGLMISLLRLQPFLVTLATWSILNGIAMIVLPTDGGSVPGWWVEFGYMQFLGLASPVWMLILLLVFWTWFRATRLGVAIKATGSNEKSAFLSGVSITRINVATYGLSGLFAAGAALFLTTQIGAGSPTIGKDYILPSVAAAVIGGVSLFGGRGHLAGTLIGAFILTLIGNLVFVLKVSSYWQPVASGVILLLSVLASSVAEKAARARAS